MSQTDGQYSPFDEIDIQILQHLAEDPRVPYAEISERLKGQGHEMTPEGVRYRVSSILEKTTVFFLLDPQQVSYEIVRLMVRAVDGPGSKQAVYELLCELPFWHVSRGIGTYDAYAVGTVEALEQLDEFVTTIREDEHVEEVEYLLVTQRNQNMKDYVDVQYIEASHQDDP